MLPYLRAPLIRALNSRAMLPAKRVLQHLGIARLKMDYAPVDKSTGARRAGPPPELRAALMEQFMPDIRRLERLLGKDLAIWVDKVEEPTKEDRVRGMVAAII